MDKKPREADIDSEDGLGDDILIVDFAMLGTKQKQSSVCIFFTANETQHYVRCNLCRRDLVY